MKSVLPQAVYYSGKRLEAFWGIARYLRFLIFQ